MIPKKNIKPKIFNKSKIGKDKYITEINLFKNIKNLDPEKTAFYKYPGEKTTLVPKEIFTEFKVIDSERYNKILTTISKKKVKKGSFKDNREKGSVLYFQSFDPEVKTFGSAIPHMFSFIDAVFKYPKTKHGYNVTAVINPERKIIGYTTIKNNPVVMRNLQTLIKEETLKSNGSVLKARTNVIRHFSSLISEQSTSKTKINRTYNFYKLLEKLKFEVYFTPEKGYKLDKEFNFVLDKK
jgi:hypothetical protein